MKSQAFIQRLLFVLFAGAIFISCSRLKKAKNFITNPSAKEVYARELEDSPDLFKLWKEQSVKALDDSVAVNLPYIEKGYFSPRSFSVFSYEVQLKPGEKLNINIATDSSEAKVFIDLFLQQGDSLPIFRHLQSAKYDTSELQKEISRPGNYKILVQPAIEANTAFELEIFTEPVYSFPVVSATNSSIQSYWGAARDGGKRSHEGIDIFAPRGTPAVAAVKGRVSSTGNKGLGGKQVWLRDTRRGNSLYYAHLDSISAIPGMAVSAGDTLGFVGNTGNAHTTPPHLHFGIYKGYRGAINPTGYVSKTSKPQSEAFTAEFSPHTMLISTATANLRSGPSTASQILNRAEAGDTLQLLGKTKNWYHIQRDKNSFFIHESLVSILE